MDKRRVLTALRLLCHWSLGMVIGSLMTADGWNPWALMFVCLYLWSQFLYAVVDRYGR